MQQASLLCACPETSERLQLHWYLLEVTWEDAFIPAATSGVRGLAAMTREAEKQGVRGLTVSHQPLYC